MKILKQWKDKTEWFNVETKDALDTLSYGKSEDDGAILESLKEGVTWQTISALYKMEK